MSAENASPWARPDLDRLERTGHPEVIFGAGKSSDQVVRLLARLSDAHPERAILATRLDETARRAVAAAHPTARIDPLARTATLGPLPSPRGTVAVIAAGTSDQAVAAEAERTLEVFGAGVRRIDDVGVAGPQRIHDARPEFADADALVVVAGMEGALPSVVGGMIGLPLIAVPTSVGYGASFGGLAALLAMLNSCAPGVVVVNIDNGFSAAVHAARIARAVGGVA